MKEAARKPTKSEELVMVYPKFLGWVYAYRESVGGGWLPINDALEPMIWRLEWPQELWARLITPKN